MVVVADKEELLQKVIKKSIPLILFKKVRKIRRERIILT
jgi:hypothetical protein